MADKPARALVIYGDGLAGALGPEQKDLHALALSGSCGFLALRENPVRAEDATTRVVRELAQLLDLYDVYFAKARDNALTHGYSVSDKGFPSLSERFMGIKAAFITNSKPAAAFAASAGFSVKALDDLQEGEDEGCKLPDPAVVASSALKMLNLSGGTVGTDFDLVFLHIVGSDQVTVDGNEISAGEGLSWVDALVSKVSEQSQPGTKVGSHLYLAVMLGYGLLSSESYKQILPSLESLASLPEELSRFRPRQSYTLSGGHPVEDVRSYCPLLAVYYLNAVTRRDDAKCFGFDEFLKRGGNLTILADRALHEIAFKLWKAPKYGA